MTCRHQLGDGGLAQAVGVVLAVLLGGCAAGGAPKASRTAAQVPASPAQASDEISQLERRIAASRRALGLPARARAEASSERAVPGAQESATGDAAPEAPTRTALAPPSVEVGKEPSDPCRHTRAICSAAERICSLAEYLGEPDARARCTRAREDCEQARRTTGCD